MPRIPRALIDEMVAHAREDLPNEACGMVHAREGAPVAVHRVRNTTASPYRYEMDGLEVARLERQRDESGETLFAIYHSHVASEARPSMTDIRQAFFPPGEIETGLFMYPEALYILVSLADDPPPSVRAWRIVREEPHLIEEPIEVV
ncbi:MAG TPA: M67 family metallopeptidase [Dehalococcoidia bacterium]|nr:M67 family metallopeptidase [Dehalococcoidia bacterium]